MTEGNHKPLLFLSVGSLLNLGVACQLGRKVKYTFTLKVKYAPHLSVQLSHSRPRAASTYSVMVHDGEAARAAVGKRDDHVTHIVPLPLEMHGFWPALGLILFQSSVNM